MVDSFASELTTLELTVLVLDESTIQEWKVAANDTLLPPPSSALLLALFSFLLVLVIGQVVGYTFASISFFSSSSSSSLVLILIYISFTSASTFSAASP